MTQLARPEPLFPIAPNVSDEDFSKYAKSSKFLSRIQLYGGSSKLCKMGKIGQGHFGFVLSKDRVDDLGKSFDCLVVQFRLKAMNIKGERPMAFFDKDSDTFQEIVEKSAEKDSGCMWGPEFLLWIPQRRAFASFFFCNPTMRNVAEDLKQLHGCRATIESKLIETKQYMWHGPNIIACSTPFDLPTHEAVMEENEKFVKVQPEQTVEDDDDAPEANGRDR